MPEYSVHAPADASSPSALPGPLSISDREFTLLRQLIQREAGIHLSEAKRALLVARLAKRVRQLGLRSLGAYYSRVVAERGAELERLLDSVCTNETHFFREARQFEFLEQQVFPAWRAQVGERRIRVWSAGCATGEEPYSLAMTLLHHFPPASGWRLEIVASDLSMRALERARAGEWPIERANEIPPHYLKAYMLRGTGSQQGRMRAGPEIRAVVRFERLNLNDEAYAVPGPFDLVLCRNVLIYFDADGKQRVFRRLLAQVAASGYLFLGLAESLTGVGGGARGVGPSIYRRALAQTPWRQRG